MLRLFLLSLMIIPALANAQTIHWLTFIDTKDPNVGGYDIRSREVLYSRFINIVNAAIAEKGYRANIQDIYGSDLTPQKCKNIVTQLDISPDDIIVFYYIGHGTHGRNEGDVWPLMCLGQNYIDYFVPLKWVHSQLKSKGAKLTVTIGMCCNTYYDIPHIDAPTFSANYGNASISPVEKNAIQKMFLGYSGDFILSSASPGESSYAYKKTPLGAMDIFTCSLVINFQDSASEGTLEWEPLFNDVKEGVKRAVRSIPGAKSQTPIFTANLSKTAIGSKSKPSQTPVNVKTPQPQTDSSSTRDWLNDMGLALDNLIDTRQNESARIDQASTLENLFTSNAVVKVMSQDGDMVVDKSSADDFIGRLATSRILLKVVPVSAAVKGGKISELKVKEIYKK